MLLCPCPSQDGKLLFEQELYNNFTLGQPKSYFLSFVGDVSFFIYFFLRNRSMLKYDVADDVHIVTPSCSPKLG